MNNSELLNEIVLKTTIVIMCLGIVLCVIYFSSADKQQPIKELIKECDSVCIHNIDSRL